MLKQHEITITNESAPGGEPSRSAAAAAPAAPLTAGGEPSRAAVHKRIQRTISLCEDEGVSVETELELICRTLDELLLLRKFRADQAILKRRAAESRLAPIDNPVKLPVYAEK